MQQNQQFSQPKLTEKELLNDLLMTEKQLIGAYTNGITESSCPNMRQVFSTNLMECATDQFTVFDNMQKKGYYQIKDAADNDVQTAKQHMSGLKSSLGI